MGQWGGIWSPLVSLQEHKFIQDLKTSGKFWLAVVANSKAALSFCSSILQSNNLTGQCPKSAQWADVKSSYILRVRTIVRTALFFVWWDICRCNILSVFVFGIVAFKGWLCNLQTDEFYIYICLRSAGKVLNLTMM